MFFPRPRDAARAVSQSSRDKSEVRDGECGGQRKCCQVHAPLQVGCSATSRTLSPEKLTLISVCICTCSAPREPLLSTARGLCPVLLTGGCVTVSQPSALYSPLPAECSPFPAPTGTAPSLPVLQLQPCFLICLGAAPYQHRDPRQVERTALYCQKPGLLEQLASYQFTQF